MYEAKCSTGAPPPVDKTDWLKTAAIIFVSAGHFGFFFVEDDRWWSVFGRFAAPPFFFLIGYAQSRTVPLYWIWIGVILTLLESWNAEWTWVAPNILLSFVLIRIARPYVQQGLEKYGWAAFALLVCAFIAAQPIAARLVDYGAEGWLWALFGLCQRRFADNKSPATGSIEAQAPPLAAHATNVNWSSDTPRGLHRRCGCFCRTRTKGIFIPAAAFDRFHCGAEYSVRQPMRIRARSKPDPTCRAHRGGVAPHRPANF